MFHHEASTGYHAEIDYDYDYASRAALIAHQDNYEPVLNSI